MTATSSNYGITSPATGRVDRKCRSESAAPAPPGTSAAMWMALGGVRVRGGWKTPERDRDGNIIGHHTRFDSGGHTNAGPRGLTLQWPLSAYAGTSAQRPIIICEGVSDTVALIGLGLDAVGAPMAGHGADHLAVLLRGRHVAICQDNDGAGRKGAAKLAAALQPGCASVRVFGPPDEFNDAREWIVDGCAGIENFLAAARGAPAYEAQRPAKGRSPQAADGEEESDRVKSRDELLAKLDKHSDELLDAMADEVKREAEEMLLAPDLIGRILAEQESMGIIGEGDLKILCYLIGTSRLLRKPLAGEIQGLTCTGKTFVPLTTARMFPPEAVVIATDITTNALYYMPPSGLMHKWVVAGEQRRGEDDDHADARKALREMLESGELSKLVPMKSMGGRFQTHNLRCHGPIAFTESTTKAKLFDEDANRCLRLGADDSQEQTKRIVEAQARRAEGRAMNPEPVVARHHALQRMLRRVRVEIPYARALAAAIPTDRPEARRAMPLMLAVIEAVALLHQRQRSQGEISHGATIVALPADYAIARRLLQAPLGRALGGGIPDAVAGLGTRLRVFEGRVFTSTEVLVFEQANGKLNSKSKVNEYLKALAAVGVVQSVVEAKGNRPGEWRLVGEVPSGGAEWLPDLARVGGGVT